MFRRRVTATILNRPTHAGFCTVCGGWSVRVVVALTDVVDESPVGVTDATICLGCGHRQIAEGRRVP